jgi:hypothetical protein
VFRWGKEGCDMGLFQVGKILINQVGFFYATAGIFGE